MKQSMLFVFIISVATLTLSTTIPFTLGNEYQIMQTFPQNKMQTTKSNCLKTFAKETEHELMLTIQNICSEAQMLQHDFRLLSHKNLSLPSKGIDLTSSRFIVSGSSEKLFLVIFKKIKKRKSTWKWKWIPSS